MRFNSNQSTCTKRKAVKKLICAIWPHESYTAGHGLTVFTVGHVNNRFKKKLFFQIINFHIATV